MGLSFRHFLLWVAFVVLWPVGFLGLININGGQISGSDLFLIAIIGFLFALVMYPVTFFPLVLLLERFFHHWYVKVVVYGLAGGAMGGFLTVLMIFPPVAIGQYDLNRLTTAEVFGLVGLVFAMTDIGTGRGLNRGSGASKGIKVALTVVCLVSLTFISFCYYQKYTYNMHADEQGILDQKVLSPNQKYIAKAYGFPYGGGPGGVKVRVDVVSTSGDFSKSIYYGEWDQHFSLKWLDNQTLHIENPPESITLKVFTQIYDESGTACVSLAMKGKYEQCFQF